MTKPRILHAPVIALYQPYLQTKGLKELGYEADYVILDQHDFARFTFGWDDEIKSLHKGGNSRLLAFILKATQKYDIFHFHSLFGFTSHGFGFSDKYSPDPFSDIRLLKRLGKVICYQSWGCDARLRSIDEKYEFSTCLYCAADVKSHCDDGYKRKLNRTVEEYADFRFGSGDYAVHYQDTIWTYNCIDTEFWRPLSPEQIPPAFRIRRDSENTLLVYHSFANDTIRGDVKGTQEIKAAVARLAREGYGVQLIYCNSVDFRDLRYYQAQADIVVDQLRCGFYGSTAVECMSMGKPVISYMRDDVLACEPRPSPVVNANPLTIYDVLRELVVDNERRIQTGRASRAFAEEFHDYRKVARNLEEHYQRALSRSRGH